MESLTPTESQEINCFSRLKSVSVPIHDFQQEGVRGKGLGENPTVRGGSVPPVGLSPYPCTVTKNNSNSILKRRSVWFYLARDSLAKISDLGRDKLELGKILLYFDKWRENYRDKYVRLVKDDVFVFIKEFSRFDKGYKRKLKRKMEKLNFVRFDLKVELTLDPKRFFTLKDEFDAINRCWNRLRSWFLKCLGKFDFLRVLEVTKKGRPHLHVLFSFHEDFAKRKFQSHSYGFWSKFNRDLYRVWGLGRVRTKRVFNRNNLKIVGYVLKYVNKTLNWSDKRNKVFSALLFASNKRLFGLSEELQKEICSKKSERKGFEYFQSVHAELLFTFCKEKGIEIKAYMIIKAKFEDYYEFPELFGVDFDG